MLKRKTMEKVAAEEIRVCKKNEKEDKQVKWVAKLGYVVERTTWKTIEKHAKAKLSQP
jgi:hypothetical protein